MISPAWVRQLLADDDSARQRCDELLGAADGVVIGDAEHVEAALDDRLLELVGRRRRVAAPHRVAVQVDANPPGGAWFAEMRVTGDGSGLRCRHSSRIR